MDNNALFADGFEDALVGVGTRFNDDVAVYDFDKCVEVLVKGGMDEDEAVEYLEFNTTGAYVGANTPVFIRWKTKAVYEEMIEECPDDTG